MARFLHTADWQLGMRRHFLKEEALPRFMQARIDAIVRIGEIAREQECEFVAVCGDVFESNQVDRRTTGRALEVLAGIACPVYLLPGNHDPLDAASVYRTKAFEQYVIRDAEPITVRSGLEVVGAPWPSKRPGRDLFADAVRNLEPAPGVVRVALAHGALEERRKEIDLDVAKAAIADGRIHFLALGDRHRATEVADRIWYAGAPEATDYTETERGHVLVVDVTRDACRVQPHEVGRWRFLRRSFDLAGTEDIELLADWLFGLEGKNTTVLRLDLAGTLQLGDWARLESVFAEADDLFAAIERFSDVAVRPDAFELSELGLSGFARATAETLAERNDETARDTLALLHRLATGNA